MIPFNPPQFWKVRISIINLLICTPSSLYGQGKGFREVKSQEEEVAEMNPGPLTHYPVYQFPAT